MYKFCIVGAGSIGALRKNTNDSPESKDILTHAHALYNLRKKRKIKDFYIVDNNKNNLKKACDKWSCRGFSSLSNLRLLQGQDVDVFVVSVNTEYHLTILDEIANTFKPRLVIVEKPFCENYKQAHSIFLKYKRKHIPIVVNYIRRFCIPIQILRRKFIDKEFGEIKSCIITYVRGLRRDGCHAIDLCNYFFGEYNCGNILGDMYNCYDDFSKEDLTRPVWMEYKNCKNIFMVPVDGRDYSQFEFDIFTESGRIKIVEHSKYTAIFNKHKEEIYGKFNVVDIEPDTILENNLELALYILHGNVVQYLNSKIKNYDLFCTGEDAMNVQEVLANLLKER